MCISFTVFEWEERDILTLDAVTEDNSSHPNTHTHTHTQRWTS